MERHQVTVDAVIHVGAQLRAIDLWRGVAQAAQHVEGDYCRPLAAEEDAGVVSLERLQRAIGCAIGVMVGTQRALS
jgi:hypothetical protein